MVADLVTDVRERPRPYLYVPETQMKAGVPMTRFLVRAPSSAIPDIRAAIRTEDSGLRIVSIDSADRLLGKTMDTDRLIAALSFAFGALALVLAAVGVYGLLAYDVTRRTGEIGIRMALGATHGGVMSLVFREVAMVTAIGMVTGAAAAVALGRLVAKLVFGTAPGDPRVLAGAMVVLAVVASASAWIPARRAAGLDPLVALRHD
jgi:ABC-type antimicrobial peptide transport system permease subunit